MGNYFDSYKMNKLLDGLRCVSSCGDFVLEENSSCIPKCSKNDNLFVNEMTNLIDLKKTNRSCISSCNKFKYFPNGSGEQVCVQNCSSTKTHIFADRDS